MTADEKLAALELEVMTLRVRAALFERLLGRCAVLTFQAVNGVDMGRTLQGLLSALLDAEIDLQVEIQASPASAEQKALQLRALDGAGKALRYSFAYFSDEPG